MHVAEARFAYGQGKYNSCLSCLCKHGSGAGFGMCSVLDAGIGLSPNHHRQLSHSQCSLHCLQQCNSTLACSELIMQRAQLSRQEHEAPHNSPMLAPCLPHACLHNTTLHTQYACSTAGMTAEEPPVDCEQLAETDDQSRQGHQTIFTTTGKMLPAWSRQFMHTLSQPDDREVYCSAVSFWQT